MSILVKLERRTPSLEASGSVSPKIIGRLVKIIAEDAYFGLYDSITFYSWLEDDLVFVFGRQAAVMVLSSIPCNEQESWF